MVLCFSFTNLRGLKGVPPMRNATADAVEEKLPKGIFERSSGSGIFWILYTDRDGQRHREKCGTLKAAKDRLVIRRSEKLRNVETVLAPRAVTVSALIDDAITHLSINASPGHAKITGYALEL